MEQQHIDVYQLITNRIIERLNQGTIPWRKPWTDAGHPQNLVTKRMYTGINNWLLASLGYNQNYFLTYKQVKELGGMIKKGEKGNVVIFWKHLPVNETDGEAKQKRKSLLRYYYVFNIEQCSGLPDMVSVPYSDCLTAHFGSCDEIVEGMPQCPVIKHTKQQAFYHPVKDYINTPKQGTFTSMESYFCTLFHELIHSTGHASRLNRKAIVEPGTFGSEFYSIEELTAEIGACYLNSVTGIIDKEFSNSVAYINGWLQALKNDKRLIIFASGQAQRATDFILNVNSVNKSEEVFSGEVPAILGT
ncbi:zincin-like metallopeptidase domain-containing protein [soil metagenome]